MLFANSEAGAPLTPISWQGESELSLLLESSFVLFCSWGIRSLTFSLDFGCRLLLSRDDLLADGEERETEGEFLGRDLF